MSLPFGTTLLLGSSLHNKTGDWRTERPVYGDHLPPCNAACPAGENIQRWLYAAEEGDYETAWKALVDDNAFPAIMGRVCYRPCETACNRKQVDEAVGINAIEGFIGDEALRRGWTLPPAGPESGRGVLVVGAGPCGLSAAYHLRRAGHAVTIVDAGAMPGGMMRGGIPTYRLPRSVLDGEVERLFGLGIDLHLDQVVTDVERERKAGGFDAAVVAVGAQVGHRSDIPAGDSARLVDALTLLRDPEDEEPICVGRHVAVYGGGDTALDAARTAARLGATDATVIYRRTRERMPAHAVEMDEATAEGIRFRWLSTVSRVEEGRLWIERMELDDTGFPQPTGELEPLDADTLVLALGQDTDLSLVANVPGVDIERGVIQVGDDLMTGAAGIFAGGDAIAGERSVTTAVGHGKRVARRIDAWLRHDATPPPAKHSSATFERLNTWYYSDAPAAVRPQLDAVRRRSTFDEVVGALDESTALYEARRCLSCGNCFECDNCFASCPDNAIIKLAPGQRYEVNYDYCKGCGICATECPCGAITMVAEEI